jgi:hypothetical protein
MRRWLAGLNSVGRRRIYFFLFVGAALPFIFPIRLPLYIWQETRYVFERIESCPPDKVIAISSEWIAGSQGENWPQYEALVSHCMLKGVRLVVFAHEADALAPQMAQDISERQARLYGRTYGVDYVHLGLSRGGALVMGQIGRNLKAVYPRDFFGTRTTDEAKLPILKGVDDVSSFHLFVSITYQPSTDWLVWLDPTGNVPIAFGSAGIVTTGYYPYIASGQMKGMLAGVRGAAEYETLVFDRYGSRYRQSWEAPNGEFQELRGGKLLTPLAFGHLIMILLILAGNVGMWAALRVRG